MSTSIRQGPLMKRVIRLPSRSAHFTVKYSPYPFRRSVPRCLAVESAKSRSLQRALDRYYRDSCIQHIPHARVIACGHHHLPVDLLHLSVKCLVQDRDADFIISAVPSPPLTASLGSMLLNLYAFCSPQPSAASRGYSI